MAKIQFVVFVTILVVALSLAALNNLINMKPGTQINKQRFNKDNLGVVKNIRPCGGQFEVVQWRYETCLEADAICRVPTDGVPRTFQLDFIPSQDIDALRLRFNVSSTDGRANTVHDDAPAIISDKILKSGNTYTITADAGVIEEMGKGEKTAQAILYGVSDEHVKLCAEADFIFV